MGASRTEGGFWQACATCGKRAMAPNTPAGKAVLCRACQRSQGVTYLTLPVADSVAERKGASAKKIQAAGTEWKGLYIRGERAQTAKVLGIELAEAVSRQAGKAKAELQEAEFKQLRQLRGKGKGKGKGKGSVPAAQAPRPKRPAAPKARKPKAAGA